MRKKIMDRKLENGTTVILDCTLLRKYRNVVTLIKIAVSRLK